MIKFKLQALVEGLKSALITYSAIISGAWAITQFTGNG